MNFLDDLGKVDAELKKRRGKKLVIVDPKAADCYHSCCDFRRTWTEPTVADRNPLEREAPPSTALAPSA